MKHLKNLSSSFQAEQLRVKQLEIVVADKEAIIKRTEQNVKDLERSTRQLCLDKDTLQVWIRGRSMELCPLRISSRMTWTHEQRSSHISAKSFKLSKGNLSVRKMNYLTNRRV